jgi:hypothetical protein
VRYALRRLKDANLLKERFYFPDARQSLYGLNSQSMDTQAVEVIGA